MMRRFALPASTVATVRAFSATAVALGKVVPFKLSDIGEGILKVEVLEWYVKPGDTVEAFDKLCQVQSDKATVEISSKFDGVIRKLHAEQGGHAYVGKPIVDIETDDDHAVGGVESKKEDAAPVANSPAAHATPTATAMSGEKPLATPAVRRVAMEHSVDLTKVAATGKGGRILKEDVMAFLEGGASASPASAASPAATAAVAATAAARSDKRQPLTPMQKAMVQSMSKALLIPTFGAKDEIEIDNMTAVRRDLRAVLKQRGSSVKLSYMPFFIKAASLALNEFPIINAYTNDDCTELIYKGDHNIGFAMDTPNGLIVPNVKNVQDKSILDLAHDLQELIEKGSKGRLGVADLKDGTFTLSNIGSIGATYAHPVIFPPQVAIGALGRGLTVPRFDDAGNVVKRTVINVSWCADHRVVDGATMVRFGNLFKQYIENPAAMLLDTK